MGRDGIRLVQTESLDLVLMELELPDMEGFEVLNQIRLLSEVPLIATTTRTEEMDRVRGLELGADDYITKPFSYMELLARVRAVLRRTRTGFLETESTCFADGDLSIDFASQEVLLRSKLLKLTPIEYKLLYQLVNNPGQTLSQQLLIERVWGEEYLYAADFLKVHIHHLRQKLEDDPRNPCWIVTIPRRGYKFVVSP